MRLGLQEAFEKIQAGEKLAVVRGEISAPSAQFVVRENHKKPGEPILIRADGKVGFPTMNSLPCKIGDTVRGRIQQEEKNYFLFDIEEILADSSQQ